MFRIIGAVIIVACTAAFGFSGVTRLRVRVKNLQNLITALEIMKSEICERLTPMTEILTTLSQEAQAPVSGVFKECCNQMSQLGSRSFYFIWKSAVESACDLELTEHEKKILTDMGHVLGRYDIQEQKSAITYAIRRLETCLQNAEEEKRSQSKVHAALGVSAGLFIVIILI